MPLYVVKFNVTALNDLVGNAVYFSKGDAELKLHFDGHLNSKLKTKRNLTGYIKVNKGFIGRKTNTTYAVTKAGEKAFKSHLEALEKMIKGLD